MSDNRTMRNLTRDELGNQASCAYFPLAVITGGRTWPLNESARDLFQQARQRTGEPVEDLVAAAYENCCGGGQCAHRTGVDGNVVSCEINVGLPDGSALWFELVGERLLWQGMPAALVQIVDVSKLHMVQAELARISELREVMLDVAQKIIAIDDLEEMCQMVLRSALRAIKSAQLGSIMVREGGSLRIASTAGFGPEVREFTLPLERTFLAKATGGLLDRVANIPDLREIDTYHLLPTAYGEGTYIKSALTAPIYAEGELWGIISVDSVSTDAFDEDDEKSMAFLRDNIEIAISNHLLYQEKLFLARHDSLTGIYNRSYFEEQFDLVRSRAERYGESFSLVLFDVDNLKEVNDRYGHPTGDALLKRCAAGIKAATRKSDVLARYGGDEFVCVFLETAPASLSRKLTELMTDFAPLTLADREDELPCSLSFGVAHFPADGTGLDALIRVADERMYRDKSEKSPGQSGVGECPAGPEGR